MWTQRFSRAQFLDMSWTTNTDENYRRWSSWLRDLGGCVRVWFGRWNAKFVLESSTNCKEVEKSRHRAVELWKKRPVKKINKSCFSTIVELKHCIIRSSEKFLEKITILIFFISGNCFEPKFYKFAKTTCYQVQYVFCLWNNRLKHIFYMI